MYYVYREFDNGSKTTSPSFASEELSECKKAAEALQAKNKLNYGIYKIERVLTTKNNLK